VKLPNEGYQKVSVTAAAPMFVELGAVTAGEALAGVGTVAVGGAAFTVAAGALAVVAMYYGGKYLYEHGLAPNAHEGMKNISVPAGQHMAETVAAKEGAKLKAQQAEKMSATPDIGPLPGYTPVERKPLILVTPIPDQSEVPQLEGYPDQSDMVRRFGAILGTPMPEQTMPQLEGYPDQRELLGRQGMILMNEGQNGKQTQPNTVKSYTERKSSTPMPIEKAVDDWNKFLGEGTHSDLNPITKKPDSDRIFSEDGERSIRYGKHEMNSSNNKHHYHKETWKSNPEDGTYEVDNELVRAPLRQNKPPKSE
jgi:hypothetical protein